MQSIDSGEGEEIIRRLRYCHCSEGDKGLLNIQCHRIINLFGIRPSDSLAPKVSRPHVCRVEEVSAVKVGENEQNLSEPISKND